MEFNYSVNRVVRRHGRRKGIKFQNGVISVPITRRQSMTDAGSAVVCAWIRDRHPGWSITGYCPRR